MKYNVYLAEDEYMLREYVKSNQMWEKGPYILCGDASNGEDAWEDIQNMNVDILITDIKMPFMDGLGLCRLVRTNRPEIKIIILSGYDDFVYAKQALALGVMDYLLKPLKPEDLLKTLERAVELIEQEREQRQSISMLQELADESLEASRHKFLSQLCSGCLPQDVVDEKASWLRLSLRAESYTCCVLTIYELQQTETDSETYLTYMDCTQVMRSFEKEHSDCVWFANGIGQFRFIVLGGPDEDVLEQARIRMGCVQEILSGQPFGLSQMTAVIGPSCGDISALSRSMLSAQIAASLLPKPQTPGVSMAQDCMQLPANPYYTAAEKDLFRNFLATGSLKDVPEFVALMAKKLGAAQISHLYLTYICVDILSAVSDFVKALGCSEEVLSEFSAPDLSRFFRHDPDLSGFQAVLENLAIQAILLRERRKGGKNDEIIQRARAFILDHYTEPTLDLSAVARHVSINSAYFSTLFKQETGQCFIEYLTFLRINKAKELLRATQLRTSDIAFSVGYNDQNYFSKVFKKYVGMSARDFRQN